MGGGARLEEERNRRIKSSFVKTGVRQKETVERPALEQEARKARKLNCRVCRLCCKCLERGAAIVFERLLLWFAVCLPLIKSRFVERSCEHGMVCPQNA